MAYATDIVFGLKVVIQLSALEPQLVVRKLVPGPVPLAPFGRPTEVDSLA
jgi:hypothetical protein